MLLDDPLSAVDPLVGKHLFRDVVCGPRALFKGAAVVLVTHQLQHLRSPYLTRVLALSATGSVVASGTFSKVEPDIRYLVDGGEESGGVAPSGERDGGAAALAEVWEADESSEEEKSSDSAGDGDDDEGADFANIGQAASAKKRKEKKEEECHRLAPEVAASSGAKVDVAECDDAGPGDLVSAEVTETGSVRWATYLSFLRAAGGSAVCAGLALLILAAQVFVMAVNVWLIKWAQQKARQQDGRWITGFAVLSGVAVILSVARALGAFRAFLVASR